MLIRKFDELEVRVFQTRDEMGAEAGKAIEKVINAAISEKGEARVIFASAPSQNEMLRYLKDQAQIQWDKVVGFHMDEYVGIDPQAPQSFSKFLEDRLIRFKKLKAWYPMMKENRPEQIEAYASLLSQAPIDLVVLGIGENGHLAFNDPWVCDFDDPETVKVVALDEVCRQQQVNDGCFASLEEVPHYAFTITMPVLIRCRNKIAVVPGPTKKYAIEKVCRNPVGEDVPATVLRTCPGSIVYVDKDSYSLVEKGEGLQ